MFYRGFYISSCEDSGIERTNPHTDKVEVCNGYYCQVYADSKYNYQIDDFCIAVQIKTDKEKFGNYLVSLGVCRLFQAILRTMKDKLEEAYRSKPALTDKKLWRRIEEKRQALGLKH